MKRVPEIVLLIACVAIAAMCAATAGGAPITITTGDVISGWNVRSSTNPGGYTQSPYLADGVTVSPEAQRVISALAPAGGVIRYTGAQQTQGSPETSPANRSTNNLSSLGITWEGISAMSNLTHTSPWVSIPQGAYANAGTTQSYSWQMGFNIAQHLDPRIPNVWVEYSNELWSGGDGANGTANLFRARADPTLTATNDTQRMAQEAGRTWGQVTQDFSAGFKAGGGKAQVNGVFGGFIASSDWASTALTFAKATVPGLNLANDRLAVAPYAPGAPSDIGGIQPGDTAATIIARSQAFAQQNFPAWIASNKAVADSFGMKGIAYYELMGGDTYDYTSGTTLMAYMNRSAPEMRAFETWLMNFAADLADGKLDGKNADPAAMLEVEGSGGIPYNNVNAFSPKEFYDSPDSPKFLGFTDFVSADSANVDPFAAIPEPSILLLAPLAFLARRGIKYSLTTGRRAA